MKKLIAVISSLSLFASAAPMALADQTLCPGGIYGGVCGKTLLDNPGSIIANFITFIFVLAIIVALLYLIWGGFKWLTSGGDKTAVQAAREHIIAALVGLILIFLSYFILNLIVHFFLPGFDINKFKIPSINGSSASTNTGNGGGSSNTCSPTCSGSLVCHNGECCAYNPVSKIYAC